MWEACGDGVDEGLEDGLLVVSDDEDFLDFGNIGDCTEAMLDYRVAGDREEGLYKLLVGVCIGEYNVACAYLGKFHGQRPKPGTSGWSTDLGL